MIEIKNYNCYNQLNRRKGDNLKKQDNFHLYPVFTKADLPLQAICIIGVSTLIGLTISLLTKVNLTIPSTFSLEGKPIQYSSKYTSLSFLFVALIFYSLGWFLETHLHLLRYPVNITEKNAEKFYKPMRLIIIIIKTEFCFYITYLIYNIKSIALNKTNSLLPYSQVCSIAVLLLTCLIGYLYLKKLSKSEPPEIEDD